MNTKRRLSHGSKGRGAGLRSAALFLGGACLWAGSCSSAGAEALLVGLEAARDHFLQQDDNPSLAELILAELED